MTMNDPMPMNEYDVLIAGAGVGGAALALALGHQYDLRVLLVDRRSGPGNVNRGDSLLPAVTGHLRAWGALDAIVAAGARRVTRMQVYADGQQLYESPLEGDEAAPYLVLPHPEIERVLVERAAATGRVEVRYGCRLAGLVEERGRVCGATLAVDDARTTVRASLVIGADGSASTVRGALGIALPTRPYEHGFYIIEVDRPPQYEDAMRVELHPDGGVLVVPQGADRVGLGVLVRPPEMALFRSGTLEAKLAAIARRSPLLAGRKPFPRGAHLYTLCRGHARTYVARGAALLGDAVHLTNPTVGQGMTMAIEDAGAIARHVGGALERRAPLDEHLRDYEAERRPRNDALILWSHWLSRVYALGGPLGDPLHRSLFRLGASPLGRGVHRYLWARMATRAAA
jgi:2-polyprenyl-6-methoxyphenol hydroxylase-like FAD-dependent oxidoreductase